MPESGFSLTYIFLYEAKTRTLTYVIQYIWNTTSLRKLDIPAFADFWTITLESRRPGGSKSPFFTSLSPFSPHKKNKCIEITPWKWKKIQLLIAWKLCSLGQNINTGNLLGGGRNYYKSIWILYHFMTSEVQKNLIEITL